MHESQYTASSLRPGMVGLAHIPQGKDQVLHRHGSWELNYYCSGRVGCPVGDRLYVGEPGVLLVVPPLVPHGEFAWTAFSSFYLTVEVVGRPAWPVLCTDDADHSFEHLFAAIVREWQGSAPGRDEILALLLRQLDIMLWRSNKEADLPRGEHLVREAERLFYARISSPLRISSIARELGVSSATLRSHFVRLRGVAPLARLHALRVEHAINLISISDFPLEAVAEQCGYDSASHLSRQVRRATGKSPGMFEKKIEPLAAHRIAE